VNLVFVHLGKNYPLHMFVAIKQAIKYFEGRLFVVGESPLKFLNKNIQWIDAKILLKRNENHIEFCKYNYLNNQGLENFWTFTLTRMFCIEQLMKELNLRNVLHLENDVLIYHNPELLKFPYEMNLTNVTPQHDSICYTCIKELDVLEWCNNQFVYWIKQPKEDVKRLTGTAMITEMILLHLIVKDSSGRMGYLPILPEQTDLNIIWDGASWGQYVGGIHGKPVPGWTEDHHYVGKAIKEKGYGIVWNSGEPWVIDAAGERICKLANLHIHSKRLELYC
jgi:hypothetical protein